MKTILQYIGVAGLFCFSFFYTDKAVTVVKNIDPIIINIKENMDTYKKESINAIINDDEIIPGINGCIVNIDKSYSKMKIINTYNPKLLQFSEVKPGISLNNNFNKYIVKGNTIENEVALVIRVIDNDFINYILNIIKEKNIPVNFFVEDDYLEKNINYINKMSLDNEIYNAGNNGIYDEEELMWQNGLIDTLTNNKSTYCLNINSNSSMLNTCAKNRMYSIKPNIIINSSNYITEKNNISKGSIIYVDSNNINSLANIISYLQKKGFNFILLSEMLNEKGCSK